MWVVWWAVLFWLWLLITGDWNLIDVVGAACGAAVGATIAESIRRAARQGVTSPTRVLRASVGVLPIIAVDFAIVVWALLRSLVQRRVVRGAFVTRPYPNRGDGDRAWVTLVAGFSPNAYVIDFDHERETVLLHDLVAWRRSEEPA